MAITEKPTTTEARQRTEQTDLFREWDLTDDLPNHRTERLFAWLDHPIPVHNPQGKTGETGGTPDGVPERSELREPAASAPAKGLRLALKSYQGRGGGKLMADGDGEDKCPVCGSRITVGPDGREYGHQRRDAPCDRRPVECDPRKSWANRGDEYGSKEGPTEREYSRGDGGRFA